MLHLKPGSREHFLAMLAEQFPEQLPLYQRLYARRAYLPAPEIAPVRARLNELSRRHGIADRRSVRPAPRGPAQLQLHV